MRRFGFALLTPTILLLLCACTLAGAAPQKSLLAPMIGNSGFEAGLDGWSWGAYNGCKVTCSIETRDAHSGNKCAVFTSESSTSPNVYGRLSTPVPVLPDTQYELSVWERGQDVAVPGAEGQAGISHFTDWNVYRLDFPTGTYGWTRVATTFKTGAGQRTLNLGVNIVNKCKTLAIDDIVLRPLGVVLKGSGISGSLLAPSRLVGNNAPGSVAVIIQSTHSDAVIEVSIKGSSAALLSKRKELRWGENALEWRWDTGRAPFGQYTCLVSVLDSAGKVVATASKSIEKANSPIYADIDRVEARFAEFEKLYHQCKARRIPLDYPETARTLLTQFIPLARQDLQNSQDWRAGFAVTDFNRTLDQAMAEMRACLDDPSLAPNSRRYQTGSVSIDGLSFIGDRKDTKGVRSRGPVFFVGYGHFSQAREDMPRWPGYGVNIIQAAEFGPSGVLTAENEVSLGPVKTLLKTLDSAAKHNVRVDWLLSPHYFPQWAMTKWPHLAKGNGGFLGFCVDAPEAKQVVEKFLRIVVPMIKNKPALHSICLSNEPLFINTLDCDNTKAMWVDYLTGAHGSIGTLNGHYGTAYASFAEVPYPTAGSPGWYDYCIFNQERFAGWHKWMADVIHSMAPNVPVHAKIMSTELNPDFVGWGVDHELFAQATEINGNDCYVIGNGGPGWGINLWFQNASYDMQRSFANTPIFNSENHLTYDGSTAYTAPEHFRTALWQGAIHGQGGTTLWVWERSNDPSDPLYGNVMDRPSCAQAVGLTCLDLNRFAEEVTALQNVKAPVAMLYSMSSMVRNGATYPAAVWRAYTALCLCGVRVDFISERQLAAGKGAQYRMIILPQATSVTDAAFEAIRALPASTRVVFLNECLTGDPYGKTRPAKLVNQARARALVLTNGDPETVIWPALREELGKLGALPGTSLVDPATGKPLWGVEWLPAQVGGRTVINIVNLRDKPMDVSIIKDGKPVEARDLLSLGSREGVRALKPVTPVLAEVK